MNKNLVNKELVQRLINTEGKVKGAVFQTDRDYVIQEKGEEGLEKVKERAKELDCEIPYETAEAMKWYPLGLRVVSLLVIKETFGWSDDKIREMGYTAPQNSFIVRLVMRWLINFTTFVKSTPKIWKKHYSAAEIEIVSMDPKKKEDVLRLKGIENLHPILCTYLTGYFLRMHRYVLGPKATIEHIKCVFKGDSTCDFKHGIKR